MQTQPTKATETKKMNREQELRKMLEARKRELVGELQAGVKRIRTRDDANDQGEVLDTAEFAENDVQDDLQFALMQMKAETLEKVNDALARLETGDFGVCVECEEEIPERRLLAMPFARRCTACESQRETRMSISARAAAAASRPGFGSIFDAR